MEKFHFLKEHNSTQRSPITFPFREETLRIVSKNQAFQFFCFMSIDWEKGRWKSLREALSGNRGSLRKVKLWKNRSRSRSCPPRQDGYRCKAAFAGFRALKTCCGSDIKVRDASHAKKLKNSIRLRKKGGSRGWAPAFMGMVSKIAHIGCHHLTCRSADHLSLEPGPTLVDMVTTGFANPVVTISTRVGPGSRLGPSAPTVHAITGYYVVTMGTHSQRRSTRNRLFLAIGRGLTLPTSTVRLKMFSSIQSTIDSLVYRWWQRDFWTEHFLGLGPTD